MESATSCGRCGTSLPEEADTPEHHLPCPNCGSLDRNKYATETGTVSEGFGVAVTTQPGPRPWIELWHQVRHEYDELETMHSGQRRVTNQQEIQSTVNNFFVSCYSLKDHIKKDLAVPAPVRNKVEAYVRGDTALALCRDIANTTKHQARQPGKRSAQLSDRVTSPDGTVTAKIEVIEVNGTSSKQDAFDVARDAIRAWAKFISSNGLK